MRTAPAWPDGATLRIEPCPYCGRTHWHVPREQAYDIRPANCRQRDLPKRLRGRALYYRLHRVRSRRAPPCACEVIPLRAKGCRDARRSKVF